MKFLIKNGHVIDPKNGLDAVMDVAIDDGKIVQVSENIAVESASQIIEAKGLYVVPGLIDIHSHHFFGTESDAYLNNSFCGLPPDGFTFRAGVTTVVDTGSAGWRNFRIFKRQTLDNAKTRVLALMNIVGMGMRGGAFEQNLCDMDAKLTAMEARQFPEHIVGIKVAHYRGPEWMPVERTVEAGKLAELPVMIDFGFNEPPLSLETLFLEKLRPGDIFTHCYANVKGRMPVVDEEGKLRPFVLEAQKKGIVFDVGHGAASFVFSQAIPAIEQGFRPNSISTDLHADSMNGGMKDMTNVMSKFLNMGFSLKDIIQLSTWNPAQIIRRTELGHFSPGAVADMAILNVENGDFGFVDAMGWKIKGDKKIICELTLRAGEVVWDLNGISRPLF